MMSVDNRERARMSDRSKGLLLLGVAILGAVVYFNIPTVPEMAARDVWEGYSPSKQAALCEGWNQSPELYGGDDPTAVATRGLLKKEC